MPNPKRRHSKTRGRKRRTHYKATVPPQRNARTATRRSSPIAPARTAATTTAVRSLFRKPHNVK